ncbi:MAG: ATP-binding protein [Candidatus Methylomirabilales bacterium]
MLALVVDNDRFFRELLREILADLGYTVHTAADGLEALDAVVHRPPDVVLLDLVMPKVGGDRVCAYLKSDPATSAIPIVILSATVAEDRARVMAMGADACIAKGPAEELRQHVRAALGGLARPQASAPPAPGMFGVERAHPRGMVVELLALKRHHEAILTEIAEGVVVADASGKVTFLNPAAGRLLARAERDVIGQDLAGLFDADTAGELRAGLRREGPALSLTVQVGGRVLLLRASALGCAGDDGGWLVVLQDQTELWEKITELSVLNQRLQAVDKLKSEFLAMVSHDLKTPLSTIRCGLEMLANPQLPAAARERILHTAVQGTERLGRMVSDLLDSARIEAGKLELHPALLDVEEVLRRTADRFRGVAVDRSVQLLVEVPGKLPRLGADPARLDQVLENLLSNAVKAVGAGGRVVLAARAARAGDVQMALGDVPPQSPGVELTVADDGPGIPPEHLAHVFEKFYRAGGGEGAGLGLYICKALVEEHGGGIVAESVTGVGTRIRVWLPIEARSRG